MDRLSPRETEKSDREGRRQKKGSVEENCEGDGMNQPKVEMVDCETDMNGGQPRNLSAVDMGS